MLQWDDALLAACPSYPNIRVFNWAAMAQSQWFISDGIHYTSAGSAARSAAIADALATRLPAATATAWREPLGRQGAQPQGRRPPELRHQWHFGVAPPGLPGVGLTGVVKQ